MQIWEVGNSVGCGPCGMPGSELTKGGEFIQKVMEAFVETSEGRMDSNSLLVGGMEWRVPV